MSGPVPGRRRRADFLRGFLACLALIGLGQTAAAQTLTSNLMNPVRDGFVSLQDSPLRKIGDPDADRVPPTSTVDAMAPSRIGKIPTYGVAAANGASDMGYDSL